MFATAAMKRTTPTHPPFDMTERDIDILAFNARVRYATKEQMIRFTGGSPKNVGNRIRHLLRNGYLQQIEDREALKRLFNLLGNTAPVFGLATSGRQLVAQRGIAVRKKSGKAPLIPHTVAETDFVLACALASRTDGAPRFIHQSDLLPMMPEETRALEHPFRFRVPFQDDFKPISLNVRPDFLMSLLFDDGHTHNFCVEIDLMSETIAKRHNGKIVLSKSTFARKQAGYYFGWREGRHGTQWGWQGFRVLTVTPSPARIASMIDAQREVTGDRATELFLYTTQQQIAEHGAFAPIWRSAERENVSIIERS